MLDLFTVVWGEMIELSLEGTLPSLLQPDNIPASKGLLHSYNFYASEEAKQKITQNELYAELFQQIEVNWFPLQKGEWELTSNYLHQMRISAEERHYMLLVSPDNVYGNGSILNIARLCDGEHNPILYSLLTVSDEGYEILRSLFKARRVISNRELVSIGMPYMEGYPMPVEKRDNYWIVRHNIPEICLLPDDKILSICATNPNRYAAFDHFIPYTMVEMGYPWHLIRHSDIYFLVGLGRHVVREDGSNGRPPALPWRTEQQLLGLEFFGKEEVIWQGAESQSSD